MVDKILSDLNKTDGIYNDPNMEKYNITIFGAGNQKLYEKLNIKEKFGGSPPYGGAAMAIQMAKAGHNVVLAEPNKENLTEDHWKIVENAGVKVISDDIEGAKHGEICIFFTPYGARTTKIVKKIMDHIPENAVLCNTCTISPVVAYILLEVALKTKRKDVGISSMHPMGVPGTETQKDYIVSKECTNGTKYASEEQINKLINIVNSINKIPNVVHADVSSSIADVCSSISAITLGGLLETYKYCVNDMEIPPEMVIQQILISLNTISALIESSGLEGLMECIDNELLVKSAKSMVIHDEQTLLKESLNSLIKNKDLISKGRINPSYLLPSQAVVADVKKIAGDQVANGIIKRSMRKLFDK